MAIWPHIKALAKAMCRRWDTPYFLEKLPLRATPLPGMHQLWKIEPDIVHPGIGTANVRRDCPALDKIPPHMMQIKPVEDKVCRLFHDELVHLPDGLFTRFRIGDELLLLVERIALGH